MLDSLEYSQSMDWKYGASIQSMSSSFELILMWFWDCDGGRTHLNPRHWRIVGLAEQRKGSLRRLDVNHESIDDKLRHGLSTDDCNSESGPLNVVGHFASTKKYWFSNEICHIANSCHSVPLTIFVVPRTLKMAFAMGKIASCSWRTFTIGP